MNALQKRLTWTLAAFVASLAITAAAVADPLPGRDMTKFSQKPMLGTTVLDAQGVPQDLHGHDELSTAYGFTTNAAIPPTSYDGVFMADDFADNFNSPVVHVKWWGSYLNNFINPNMPVNKFLISFESDVPAGPAPSFSHPGKPLLNQTVFRDPNNVIAGPGSGTFTEDLIVPVSPTNPEAILRVQRRASFGQGLSSSRKTLCTGSRSSPWSMRLPASTFRQINRPLLPRNGVGTIATTRCKIRSRRQT